MSESTPESPEAAQDQPDVASEPGEYPEVGPHGYPEKMRWRDMRPEHQAAYWQRQAKQNDGRAKANDERVRELETKAQQWDALDEASKTEQQREVDRLARELEAERSARMADRKAASEQVVYARLDAAAEKKGMTPAQLRLLVGDTARFLGDGGVDVDAVDEFLAALPDAARPAPLTTSSLGAGRRSAPAPQSGGDLYRQMHPKRTPAQT